MQPRANDCSLCGADDPSRKVYPPGEWVGYLREKHELDAPEGALAVPLCTRCHDRIEALRRAFRRRDELTDEEWTTLQERVLATLDRVDLDALLVEHGNGDEKRRSLGW